MGDTNRITAAPMQKVVVVNGGADVIGMLEVVLDAGRYDMVFVESPDHAYSQVKRVLPDFIILCAGVEHLEAFQLLTLLKLDPDTRDIPVLAYTAEDEGEESGAAASRLGENGDNLLPSRPVPRMN